MQSSKASDFKIDIAADLHKWRAFVAIGEPSSQRISPRRGGTNVPASGVRFVSSGAATTWIPTGQPSRVSPAGTEIV